MQGIYLITCRTNGRRYVGSSRNITWRWTEHTADLEKGCHGNSHLQNAWNKYGPIEFELSILELVEDRAKLLEREQFYLDTLKPEFNLSLVAGRPDNRANDPEIKEKRRQSITGWFDRKTPEEQEEARENRRKAQREVADRLGRKEQMQAARRKVEEKVQEAWTLEKREAARLKTTLQEAQKRGFETIEAYEAWKAEEKEAFERGREARELERRRKIAEAQTGRAKTEEHKQKLREANERQMADPEQIRTRSERSSELWSDPDYRQRQVESHTGRVQSEEEKQKRADAIRGKTRSDETKKKQSEARKAYWAKKKAGRNE